MTMYRGSLLGDKLGDWGCLHEETDKKGELYLYKPVCTQTECSGRRDIQKNDKFQFLKGNSFSCSVQLDCGTHGMQLSAGQDVIRKEQNMISGVCRYAVGGGIHRLHK